MTMLDDKVYGLKGTFSSLKLKRVYSNIDTTNIMTKTTRNGNINMITTKEIEKNIRQLSLAVTTAILVSTSPISFSLSSDSINNNMHTNVLRDVSSDVHANRDIDRDIKMYNMNINTYNGMSTGMHLNMHTAPAVAAADGLMQAAGW